MTRYSKFANGQRKRPEEATKWEDFQTEQKSSKEVSEQRSQNISSSSHGIPSHRDKKSKLKKFGFNDAQEEELYTMLKKDTRRENRRVNRQKKKQEEKVCYNCRESGHNMSECPKALRDIEQGTGICFKCGSTEHSSVSCKVKVKSGEFPYAKCFICGETGHLSKQCPDNPKGLYPMGGCCKECGSVEHYKKDCPEIHSKQGIDNVTLPMLDNFTSADAEEDITKYQSSQTKKRVPKLVKF